MAESKDGRALFGFLRLRFNLDDNKSHIVFKELNNMAIIEELHVYSTEGMLVRVGDKKEGASQHRGVGKRLIKEAEKIAYRMGSYGVFVTSGFGVRGYYRKSGYELYDGLGGYMFKNFWITIDEVVEICIIIIIMIIVYLF